MYKIDCFLGKISDVDIRTQEISYKLKNLLILILLGTRKKICFKFDYSQITVSLSSFVRNFNEVSCSMLLVYCKDFFIVGIPTVDIKMRHV